MKIASHDKVKPRRGKRSEQVILFNAGHRTFAIAAESVQEIRSTDSLGGAAVEMEQAEVSKVKHLVERAGRNYFIVNACVHFGLRVTRPTLVLILRQIRAAVLVDGIERMEELTTIHALPKAFRGPEREWYRGLAYVEDTVIPVVNPSGFLTAAEFGRLDAAATSVESVQQLEGVIEG
jgi:chemotaxis signal transduction protein